ncbi:MAG: PorP/SprF family type IX secretion system membrane protein [Bacteroidia bacterium]
MKKLSIIIALVVAGLYQATAQQVPLYSHYYYNQFLYNPALAGSKGYGQFYLLQRNQWFSIPNSPVTQAFTIDGPLSNKNVGIGLGLYHDQAGQFNIIGGQAAYRYSIDLGSDNKLGFGFALGAVNNRIDYTNINPQDWTDPDLANQFQGTTGYDANIGVNLTAGDFNIGVSVPQIVGNQLAYSSLINSVNGKNVRYGLARHFITNLAYNWKFNSDWSLQPSALIRVVPNAPLQYDINAMLNYNDKYWGGAMYRSGYSATLAAGARLAQQFVAGYAYDIAIHNVRKYTVGAHEFMIGYQWGRENNDLPEKVKKTQDELEKTKHKVDSLEDELKKHDKRIKDNKDGLDDDQDEIDEIKAKIKTFDDFMKEYKDGAKRPDGSTSGTGQVYTFNNVYFDTDKWDIKTEARGELDNLATILKENPNLKIEVAGYADQRGSVSHNQWLSNKRSNAVREYLIRNGVSPDQLVTVGNGVTVSAPGLDQNRRVEFKILSR